MDLFIKKLEKHCDFLSHEKIKEMDLYIQHGNTTTYKHCLQVALMCLAINQVLKLKGNERTLVNIGVLHDFYLYDWHEKSEDHKWHGFHHSKKAARNAKEHFSINEKEELAIESHMWPLNLTKVPKSKEAWILCVADKICTVSEVLKNDRGRD